MREGGGGEEARGVGRGRESEGKVEKGEGGRDRERGEEDRGQREIKISKTNRNGKPGHVPVLVLSPSE